MAGHGILYKVFSSLGSYRNLLTSRITLTAYQQQQNVGLRMETKEKMKLLKIPEAPKRPLTPYFRFLQDHRAQMQKQNPNLKLTDLTRKCAEEWKNVGPAIKEKYHVDYTKEMAEFELKQKNFAASLTDEQSEALEMVKKEKRSSKEKRKMKKLCREAKKPKRPIGSFIYFIKEKLDLPQNKNKKLVEILNEFKGEWKNMTDAKKEKYIKMNEADRQRYEQEMKTWEAKMVKEGRADLTRKESQIIPNKPSHLQKPTQKKPR